LYRCAGKRESGAPDVSVDFGVVVVTPRFQHKPANKEVRKLTWLEQIQQAVRLKRPNVHPSPTPETPPKSLTEASSQL
jgi:hypothetical protein